MISCVCCGESWTFNCAPMFKWAEKKEKLCIEHQTFLEEWVIQVDFTGARWQVKFSEPEKNIYSILIFNLPATIFLFLSFLAWCGLMQKSAIKNIAVKKSSWKQSRVNRNAHKERSLHVIIEDWTRREHVVKPKLLNIGLCEDMKRRFISERLTAAYFGQSKCGAPRLEKKPFCCFAPIIKKWILAKCLQDMSCKNYWTRKMKTFLGVQRKPYLCVIEKVLVTL